MNRKQMNKLTMYPHVQSVLRQHQDTWSAIPALADATRTLDALISSIAGRRTAQEENTTGITTQKEQLQRQAAKNALVIAGAVRALAFKKSDRALHQSMKYSFTELSRAEDLTAKDRFQFIYDTAIKLNGSLGDYGITKLHFTRLKSSITAFDQLIESNAAKGTLQTVATKTLRQLFNDVDKLLKDMLDGMMLQFEETHPEVYTSYRHARQIIDLGGGKRGGDEPSSSN